MANKKIKKVPLDKDCLMEGLHLKNSSIRKIGKDYSFGWSSKSIERGIKDGEVSSELLDTLGQYLDIDTDYLSGKYHREIDKIEDEAVIASLKSGLRANKFPYLHNQQRHKYDGKFLYDKYLKIILIVHDISIHQFDEMLYEKQKAFQIELEDAVATVLMKHFPTNAFGQDSWPEIYKTKSQIENNDPDEQITT